MVLNWIETITRAINVLRLGQGLTFVERKPLLVSTTNVKTSKQVIIDEARSPRINSWVVHCLNKDLEGREVCIVTDYSIIQGSTYTKYFCD